MRDMRKRVLLAVLLAVCGCLLTGCGDAVHYKAVEKKAASYYKQKYGGRKPEIVDSFKAGNSGLFGYIGVKDRAYELEDGKALDGARQVTGTIVSIPSAYSEQYGNITVNLQVGGLDDLIIQCYRLSGGSELAIGDTITVSGNIKNYKGTIEFDKNCTYTK